MVGRDEEVCIRDATVSDREVVTRFNAALAWETEELRLDPGTLAQGVAAVLDDPARGRYLIAECAGRVVGQLMLTQEWSDWRNATYLWIQSVYVEAEYRRQGVFRRLFERAAELAAAPGYCGLRLYVHAANEAARATYRRLGLVDHGYRVFETEDSLRADGPHSSAAT